MVIQRTPAGILKQLAIALHHFLKRMQSTYAAQRSLFHVDQWSPFHVAADSGLMSLCTHVYGNADIYQLEDKNPGNKSGTTALHLAAESGHLEIYQFIMCKVENKNPAKQPVANKYGAREGSQETPLHIAARNGHLEICRLIMDSLENKNPADENGTTPLHISARIGYYKICELIINNIENENVDGINRWSACTLEIKNPGDIGGATPLHLASLNGNLEICQLFMNTLENKNPSNISGITPLHYAS